ncbi:MAG: FtsX-like permease family protein [Lysobacter sp.]|nr:FtsX-like permease family protein [Lysobacter sp.]
MSFLPIVLTLRRHRTAATLIVVEIALTCAIVCNAIFLIRDRLERMDRPSGVVENELVRVALAGISKDTRDAAAVTQQDLAALRAIPGVRNAAIGNVMPFGEMSFNSGISSMPDDPHPPVDAAVYLGGPDLFETFGLPISQGRGFNSDEFVALADVNNDTARIPSAILTRGAADRLYPGENPIGKRVYVWGTEGQIVVGIVDRLAIVTRDTMTEARAKYFRQDRSMAWLLVGVSIALLVITALGIVGLASFWVQQRTRQIGVRRALGATRGDILRYFQTENFILATVGIVLGMALAYAINLWLMQHYNVQRLPASFLPIGALLLWLLGQIAVLGPALRASLIPPAIATRSV